MHHLHALIRGVVLPEFRVIYVPVPKAACTTLLWLIADAAGLDSQRFAKSPAPEVAPALTVHDLNLWPKSHRMRDRGEGWLREASNDPEWLLFSVVRDPLPRVWSAWQSKLLLREPTFIWRFGEADWFPRVPFSAQGVVEDFRRFVRTLTRGEPLFEGHWHPQNELLQPSVFNYAHIGRVEALPDTIALLTERGLPCADSMARPGRENRAPLSFHPSVIDGDLSARISEFYAVDCETFGYAGSGDEQGATWADFSDWMDRTEAAIPALRDIVQRNVRVGQLSGTLQGRPDWVVHWPKVESRRSASTLRESK